MNVNFLRGPGNISLDLMRLAGAFVLLFAYPFPYLWGVFQHGVIPDPSSYGVGYAAVIGAVGVAIGAKDALVAKATATSPPAEPAK